MTELKKRGRWKAGESGNPQGRKPGTGEVAKLRAAIADKLPELLDALMKQALARDTTAARLLLERTIAPLKSIEPTAPVSMAGESLSEQARAVLMAASSSELTPGQAAQLIAAIAAFAKILEASEIEQRISALEACHGKK